MTDINEILQLPSPKRRQLFCHHLYGTENNTEKNIEKKLKKKGFGNWKNYWYNLDSMYVLI